MGFVVAIDGPAGTGKGTIAKLMSQELGLVNIDTGAMYRSITLKGLRQGISSIDKKEELIEIAQNIDIQVKMDNGNQQTFLDGENVTTEIRSKEVTDFVSQLSSIPEIREIVVDLARKVAEGKDVIMEGRDVTTVIFPNADVKIYLDADVEERAKRRYEENKTKGIAGSYEQILENIKLRDYNDMHKEVGALKIAEDAMVVDTTNMRIEEVKNKVKEIILEGRK